MVNFSSSSLDIENFETEKNDKEYDKDTAEC